MTIELIGLIVAVVATGLAVVQVWQGRHRNHPAPVDASQPLREEAVAALTEAGYVLDYVFGLRFDGGGSRDALNRELENVLAQSKELVKLHSRLKIAQGITDQEAEAFAGVIETVLSIGRALHDLLGKRLEEPGGELATPLPRRDLAALSRSLDSYMSAQREFEKTVRQSVAPS